MEAHLVLVLADTHALHVLGHDERAHPTPLLRITGLGEDGEEVGDPTVGDPHLAAVEDPAAVAELRAGLEGGVLPLDGDDVIGPPRRLGDGDGEQALRVVPEEGDEAPPLLLVAQVRDAGRDLPDLVQAHREPQVARRQLLAHHAARDDVGLDSPVLLAQGKGAKPDGVRLPQEIPGEPFLGVRLAVQLGAHGDDLFADELPHDVAEHELLLGEFEIDHD